jgi:hypothetical protein
MTKLPTEHCQNGRADICLAGAADGVCCPDDECDIDTGDRATPACSSTASCSRAGLEALAKLDSIYERQMVEVTMMLLTKINRGQFKLIREANPGLAEFIVESLSP